MVLPSFRSISTEKPVSQWKADTISSWMESMGLAVYNDTSRSYLCDGTKLLKVTASELEKVRLTVQSVRPKLHKSSATSAPKPTLTFGLVQDLGMKNPLHRKKMLLAVESLKPDASELVRAASLLDWQWTLRWLDDVGLPQYKDAFSDALVDGRVLNVLTVVSGQHIPGICCISMAMPTLVNSGKLLPLYFVSPYDASKWSVAVGVVTEMFTIISSGKRLVLFSISPCSTSLWSVAETFPGFLVLLR